MSGRPRVGLLLGGGGARAAYQVGVLKAVAGILPEGAANPFAVICGSSAGGINAAVTATYALRFQEGVRRLVGVWESFAVDEVFRADAWSALSRSSRWLLAMLTGGAGGSSPKSILDVSPLRGLLESHVAFERVDQAIHEGALRALCVTASSYSSGRSVSFYHGAPELESWSRARRDGIATRLTVDHLMASSAIPILFPAVGIGGEYFGDGSMRQTAPTSPALHLGADRLLVIGVRQENAGAVESEDHEYPGVGQIAGYILDTLFLNSLSADIERLDRINHTLEHVADKEATPLRQVETLLISPSRDLAAMAEPLYHLFPASIRYLLAVLGARRGSGRRLMSYLLFEKPYTSALIDLGYRDAMEQKAEIRELLDS